MSWRMVDGGLEVFSDPLCEYTTLGDWNDWEMPMISDDEIACICTVESYSSSMAADSTLREPNGHAE